jgi:hypothetical protein
MDTRKRSAKGNPYRTTDDGRYTTAFKRWHNGRMPYCWVVSSRNGERPWYAAARHDTEDEAGDSPQYVLELSGLVEVEMLAPDVTAEG